MISLAWINEHNRSTRVGSLDADQVNRVLAANGDSLEYAKLNHEVQRLRNENTRLQNAVANQSNQGKVLNQSLQEAKLFAALTEVEGPGIVITLRDANKSTAPGISSLEKIIHDIDVLKVVNELWASGAEAVSVNGHRATGSTSYRCSGPVIHVDGEPIASPIVIRAIGESKTLYGALNIPGGVLDEIRQTDPSMVEIEMVANQRLPAYAGNTSRSMLTLPKETK